VGGEWLRQLVVGYDALVVFPEDGDRPGCFDVHDRWEPGTAVEVFSNFNELWVGEFVVVAVVAGGYRLRRSHEDGALTHVFGEHDVRPAW
jgi:hypothetical protein